MAVSSGVKRASRKEKRRKSKGAVGVGFVVASLVAIVGLGFYVIAGSNGFATANDRSSTATSVKTTAKTAKRSVEIGPSGLRIPRFVSLKTSRVNVRRGPSSQHNIAWVFKYKGLPVEIIAEFEHWRRVRDSDGQEGWVYHSLLAGSRMVTVAPWKKGGAVALRKTPETGENLIANVTAGAVGRVEQCNGSWCQVELKGYNGWIPQTMLWGVYPDEKFKP